MDYALVFIIIIIMILLFAGGTVGAGYLTNYIFNDSDKTISNQINEVKTKFIQISLFVYVLMIILIIIGIIKFIKDNRFIYIIGTIITVLFAVAGLIFLLIHFIEEKDKKFDDYNKDKQGLMKFSVLIYWVILVIWLILIILGLSAVWEHQENKEISIDFEKYNPFSKVKVTKKEVEDAAKKAVEDTTKKTVEDAAKKAANDAAKKAVEDAAKKAKITAEKLARDAAKKAKVIAAKKAAANKLARNAAKMDAIPTPSSITSSSSP